MFLIHPLLNVGQRLLRHDTLSVIYRECMKTLALFILVRYCFIRLETNASNESLSSPECTVSKCQQVVQNLTLNFSKKAKENIETN